MLNGVAAIRALIQQGELEQALALVEQLKGLGKSVELLELEAEIRVAIVVGKVRSILGVGSSENTSNGTQSKIENATLSLFCHCHQSKI